MLLTTIDGQIKDFIIKMIAFLEIWKLGQILKTLNQWKDHRPLDRSISSILIYPEVYGKDISIDPKHVPNSTRICKSFTKSAIYHSWIRFQRDLYAI